MDLPLLPILPSLLDQASRLQRDKDSFIRESADQQPSGPPTRACSCRNSVPHRVTKQRCAGWGRGRWRVTHREILPPGATGPWSSPFCGNGENRFGCVLLPRRRPSRRLGASGRCFWWCLLPKPLLQQRGDSRALGARNRLLGGSIRSASTHSSFVFEAYTEVFYRAEGFVLSVKATRSLPPGSSWADSELRACRAVLCSAPFPRPPEPCPPRLPRRPLPPATRAFFPNSQMRELVCSDLPISLSFV